MSPTSEQTNICTYTSSSRVGNAHPTEICFLIIHTSKQNIYFSSHKGQMTKHALSLPKGTNDKGQITTTLLAGTGGTCGGEHFLEMDLVAAGVGVADLDF